ncbi:universal stress protein [Mangrovibacterium lignilyticum]|uniref:universal stress protein n=1 Tax=Mangrovibacterium lignilyticum TaxID=2668052 RepID=UPI0013D3C546|nr:universal stress protein [Mangrovibacterium lignilyticum]
MKTNVLLLDTLRNMENLIYSAFSISGQQNRKLRIVYIEDFNWVTGANYLGVTPPNLGTGMQYAETQIKADYERAEKEIKRITSQYLLHNPRNIPFEYEVREYNRLEYVDELIEQEKDVVLMMSNYSSISESPGGIINYPNILDKVACPVLVIPDDRQYLRFNKVLYATAMHSEDLDAIKSMVELLACGSRLDLHVFHHCNNVDFDHRLKWVGFQTLVKNSLPEYTPEFYLSKGKDVEESIEAYVKMENPDVIVALKERKGFFEDIFSSSHTHELIRHFNKPVLVYHEDNLK